MRSFRERGFKGTSMSEIAENVGISKAGLYHHFRSKDELLCALFEPSFGRVEELLKRRPGQKELLEGYLEIMLAERDLATLLATDLSVRTRPGVGEKVVELMRRLREQVAGEGADLKQMIRADGALWVLRSAVISFPEADEQTVREVALPAAAAVLNLP